MRTEKAGRVEASAALFLPVAFEVEHGVLAALGHQAQSARDFLIGFDLAAQIAAEAVLVELRSEEHTSELQSLMRISYAVFCLKITKPTDTYRQRWQGVKMSRSD